MDTIEFDTAYSAITIERLMPATDPDHHAERYSPDLMPGSDADA